MAEQSPKPRGRRVLDNLLVLLLAAGGIAFLVAIVFSGGDDAPPDLSGDAIRVCEEEFVPKRLKAPATAEFSGASVSGTGDVFVVTGHVDSENSFGAKIRSRYTCTVRSSGDQWRLQSASVD